MALLKKNEKGKQGQKQLYLQIYNFRGENPFYKKNTYFSFLTKFIKYLGKF